MTVPLLIPSDGAAIFSLDSNIYSNLIVINRYCLLLFSLSLFALLLFHTPTSRGPCLQQFRNGNVHPGPFFAGSSLESTSTNLFCPYFFFFLLTPPPLSGRDRFALSISVYAGSRQEENNKCIFGTKENLQYQSKIRTDMISLVNKLYGLSVVLYSVQPAARLEMKEFGCNPIFFFFLSFIHLVFVCRTFLCANVLP